MICSKLIPPSLSTLMSFGLTFAGLPRGLRAAPSGEGGGMSGIAAIGLRRAPSLFSAGYHRAGQEVAEFWIAYIVNLFLGGRS